jgi:uncharacterized protein (UPF0335 family)
MPAPLKSYIDRILTVLAEIDEKGSDKKQIYKDLAGEGYDRTVVSQVVGHIRKKAAKPGKFAEQSALFDLYMTEYEGVGTQLATHAARETDLPDHDPETGEVKEPQAETPVQTGAAPGTPTSNAGTEAVAAPAIHSQHGAESAEEEAQVATERAAPSAQPITVPRHDVEEAGEDVVTAASSPDTLPDYSSDVTPEAVQIMRDLAAPIMAAEEFEVIFEPALAPREIAEPGDRSAVRPAAAPVVADNSNVPASKKRLTFNDPAHRDCLDPAQCGGFSNLKLCQRCAEAAAVGQVA